MEFHVFGAAEKPALVLIHGMLTPWQIWQPQIKAFSADHHVIVPALDAHIAEHASEFVSVEDEAAQIEQYLASHCGGSVFAVCGLSMGGVIANRLFERGNVQMQCLVLDGAPVNGMARITEGFMQRSYCAIIEKSKARDPKTLAAFKRDFLPERFLPLFLPFADTMTARSIENMLSSVCRTSLRPRSDAQDVRILFLHGTSGNEAVSRRSAAAMQKLYPQTEIRCYKGMRHGELLIYHSKQWIADVSAFFYASAADQI